MRIATAAVSLALVATGLVLAPATASAAPEIPSALTCDPTGDGSWNDCIRHRHHGELADHVLKGDEQITVRSRVHPALEGAELDTEIQVRPLAEDGTPTGAWRTVETYTWTAEAGESKHAKSTGTCAAPEPGLYQVRKRVTIPKSHAGAVASSGLRAGDVVATSAPSTMASNGGNCTDSPDDENNIEYFNLINFMGDIEIDVTANPTDNNLFEVKLTCPEKESTDIPPATFAVVMQTVSGALQTDCYSTTPLTIAKDDSDCAADGYCRFVISAVNTETDKTYSETEVGVVLRSDEDIIPELNPATLPICNSTLADCLIAGTCAATDTDDGQLSL